MSNLKGPEIVFDTKYFLQKEDLWEIIDEELSIRIREDPIARQATFCVMLTAFQPKPAHLMLLGESAVGKSWLLTNTMSFLPPENRILLGSSTQRAWFYTGEPVYRPHPLFPDKKVVDYYQIDFRRKAVGILDNVGPKTINDLKPIMSHDAPEIEIRASEQSDGKWQTRRVRVNGCPAFLNCTTWLNWDQEISSRHFYLTPRDDPKKYEESAALLDKLHTTGEMPTSELMPEIHASIRMLRDMDLKVVVKPDVLPKIKSDFKWSSGRDVRDYERAITLIESVAWLHAFQRDRTTTNAVIADERDLEIVNGIIKELLRTSSYGTSGQVLDYYEKVLKPLAESTEQIGYDAIQSKYFEAFKRPLYRDKMILYNKTLQQMGHIELVKDATDQRRWLVRVKK